MTADITGKILEGRSTLLGFIEKKVGDEELAEDILQESLLKALKAAPELRDEEKLLPWFYRIVNNAITDYYRRRTIAARSIEEYAHDAETTVEPRDRELICRCMRDLIPTLKPEYAEMIEELELGEGDPEEVARRLGITRNNLKVRRHRARTQLKERLEETCRACATHGCLDCACRRSAGA